MPEFLEKKYINERIPQRFSFQNKGDFGHVLVVGGSVGMAGSVCMTAKSALKTGAGLVTVAVPDSIADIAAVKLTECMILPVPSQEGMLDGTGAKKILEFSEKCNTVVFGMGARKSAGTAGILEALLTAYTGTLIIDADGLNVLSENPDFFAIDRKCNLILTPHPGEMARLCGMSVPDIQCNRENVATSYAKKHSVTLVLKGENTVISNSLNTFINPTGNVGMATGGSGDVLAGIIAGFSAQGLQNMDACCCGCFTHGLAGDIAVQDTTVYCLTAGDLITYLPQAFKEIINFTS